MVNLAYHTARLRANTVKKLYRAMLPNIVDRLLLQTQTVPVIVYAFSCERDLAEQVANIHSFITQVGLPDRFIVVSDGSYTPQSSQLLERIHPCVDVVHFQDIIKKDLPAAVYSFIRKNPFGKKLAIELSLPVQQTTIYTDSDILFFPGAQALVQDILAEDDRPRYLADCLFSLDKRLLTASELALPAVNAGFMILKKPLSWEVALQRLEHLDGEPIGDTEQTIIHLGMHYNQAIALDADKYILQLDDQFRYPDIYANQEIALRHYVNPVRHKFWYHV